MRKFPLTTLSFCAGKINSLQAKTYQNSTRRNVDTLSMIGDNDYSSDQYNVTSKRNIPCNRKMVQFENLGRRSKSRQKVLHFLEMITQLDHRNCGKHSLWRHYQFPVVNRVQITDDMKKIRSRFDWQKASSGDIDTV